MSPRVKKSIQSIAAALFWLAVWQAAAAAVGRELLLPTPAAAFTALARNAVQTEFWHSVTLSLLRVLLGFASGVVLGTVFGAVTKAFKTMDILLSPLLRIVRATPVASFIILALVWISSGILPGFISMLMVIPVVWANIYEGISSVDSDLLEVAKVYRFSGFKTLKLIYLPSLRPYFKAAIITSLGMAWKSGIAAEVLCQPKGSIGIGLYYSKLYLETADLFAWTAVVIILSFIVEKGVAALLKRM